MVIYARVSSAQHQADLDRQVARLEDYCAVRSYRVGRAITEIGSGVNDSRRKFLALLSVPQINTIVVEHQARATRFGFRSVEVLLKQAGRTIEVANLAEQDREELLQDLSSIVYSCVQGCTGQGGPKRQRELIGNILAPGQVPHS